MTIGFIGLGKMGLPMARNLGRAGVALCVWNRTPERGFELLDLGARQAIDVDDLCSHAAVILVMLLDESAVDAVLGRGTPAFRRRAAGRTWVQLGTTSPRYSQALERDIVDCGGCYVEAPVSGSCGPAGEGQLIGMLAGRQDVIGVIAPLLKPLCREIFTCGPVPNALRMKLAVNHYLITTVVALAETVLAARATGLDLDLLRNILDAGPMASDVSRSKLAKLMARDFSAQAAIRDVRTISQLVAEQAQNAGLDASLIAHCAAMYRQALDRGGADLDMVTVLDVVAGNV